MSKKMRVLVDNKLLELTEKEFQQMVKPKKEIAPQTTQKNKPKKETKED